MVKKLGTYFSSPAPGRGYYHGYTKTKSYRCGPGPFFTNAMMKFLFTTDKLRAGYIDAGRAFPRFRIFKIRSYIGGNMIEIAVIFIISKNKYGFLPNFGIFSQNI